jgi:hypothetical protein
MLYDLQVAHFAVITLYRELSGTRKGLLAWPGRIYRSMEMPRLPVVTKTFQAVKLALAKSSSVQCSEVFSSLFQTSIQAEIS